MATLQSKIRICKGIKMDKDYNNVVNYTEQQLLTLCESNAHLVASANDYSFIRNKGTISTNFNFSDALQCNYMAFQNKDYANKWFFAFIDDVHYTSNGCTEIEYTIDSWSTFFSDLSISNSFVIREHVNDDTIGLHTVPENLETGEYIVDSYEHDTSLNTLLFMVFASEGLSTTSNPNIVTNVGGIPMARKCLCIARCCWLTRCNSKLCK